MISSSNQTIVAGVTGREAIAFCDFTEPTEYHLGVRVL
jgi:hypothetical protein